jgi:uncharacterized membrane protein
VSGKRYKKRRMIPATSTDLEPTKATQSTSSITAKYQAEFFSGPLPPPSLLARYNDVVPNGAERLMVMAERQSIHRESMEAQVVSGNVALQKQGNNRAFILALVVILGGIYLMATGKSGWGFAAIITSLTSLVSVFAIAKADQRRERLEKATALTPRKNR